MGRVIRLEYQNNEAVHKIRRELQQAHIYMVGYNKLQNYDLWHHIKYRTKELHNNLKEIYAHTT